MEQEQMLYELPKKASRVFIPKFISLIVLSALFYAGILLNISLLNLRRAAESQAKMVAIITIVTLIILGILINIFKAKSITRFYQTKIKLTKHKSIPYIKLDSQNILAKQDLIDKIFKTYHITLSKKDSIEGIPTNIDPSQVTNYLNQLINYAHQNQYNNSYSQTSQNYSQNNTNQYSNQYTNQQEQY